MAQRSNRILPVLLIAETRPMVAAGFRFYLNDIPDTRTVVITSGFDQVADYARNHDVALIIVGEGSHGASPLSEFHRFRHVDPAWRLALLADIADRSTIRAALSAGASGIISTSVDEHELQPAIMSMLAGSIYLPTTMATAAPPRSRRSSGAGVPHRTQLTPRQLEVLDVLAKGYSNKQIAGILGITESTVGMHLNAAFQALGVRNRTSAVLAYRHMSDGQYRQMPQISFA